MQRCATIDVVVDEPSPRRTVDDRTDAALVVAVRAGDRDAFAVLFSRWFDRVYDVARNIVRSPDTAADVAQDTFIAAWERLDRLEQVDSFGGWLLRIARNRALDRLEREGRSRPQEGETVSDLVDAGASSPVAAGRTGDPSELVTAADRDGLIAAAAVALGERDASLLDLHLRHGLTPAEIADELGVTANNAHQLLFRLRNRLGTAIGAYVLWHRGRPQCPTLAGLVGTDFDAASMTVIERHRGNCDDCTRRRAVLVAPEQLFSAAPVLIAPVVLRDRVLSGLAHAGVPAPAPSAPGPATASPPAAPPPPAGPTPTEGTTPTDTAPPIAAVTAADPTAPQPRAIGDGASIPPGDAVDSAASRRRIAVLAAVLLLLVIGGATVALATHRTADTTGQLALDGTPPTTDPTAVSGASPTTPRSGSAGTTALGALEARADHRLLRGHRAVDDGARRRTHRGHPAAGRRTAGSHVATDCRPQHQSADRASRRHGATHHRPAGTGDHGPARRAGHHAAATGHHRAAAATAGPTGTEHRAVLARFEPAGRDLPQPERFATTLPMDDDRRHGGHAHLRRLTAHRGGNGSVRRVRRHRFDRPTHRHGPRGHRHRVAHGRLTAVDAPSLPASPCVVGPGIRDRGRNDRGRAGVGDSPG